MDERRSGITRDRNAECLGDSLLGSVLNDCPFGMRGNTAVAAGRYRHGTRDQFAGLAVKVIGLAPAPLVWT